MNQAVTFDSNIKAINLPTRTQALQTFSGSILTISGFGLTTSGIPTNLQFTKVKGITNAECQKVWNLLSNTILCTQGYPDVKQAACRGDSGGPLIESLPNTEPTLVGLSSWGSSDCASGLPEGYARVGLHLDWISSISGIPIKP